MVDRNGIHQVPVDTPAPDVQMIIDEASSRVKLSFVTWLIANRVRYYGYKKEEVWRIALPDYGLEFIYRLGDLIDIGVHDENTTERFST